MPMSLDAVQLNSTNRTSAKAGHIWCCLSSLVRPETLAARYASSIQASSKPESVQFASRMKSGGFASCLPVLLPRRGL